MTQQFISDALAPNKMLLHLGSFPGMTCRLLITSPIIDTTDVEKTAWKLPGNLTYSDEQAPLFISSSDPTDIGVKVGAQGLDDMRNPVAGVGVVNGQTQAPLLDLTFTTPVEMLRSLSMQVDGTTSDFIPSTLNGTIYLAEEDTLTGGVPDTASKIKLAILPTESLSQVGFFTVPADHVGIVSDLSGVGVANKEVDIIVHDTFFDFNVPVRIELNPLVKTTGPFSLNSFFLNTLLPEGDDIEFRIKSSSPGAQASLIIAYVLIEKRYQTAIPQSAFGKFSPEGAAIKSTARRFIRRFV